MLSMTSGRKHPLSAQTLFALTFEGLRPSYEIRVCGPYVGVLVKSSQGMHKIGSELYVWDWKDGAEKYVCMLFGSVLTPLTRTRSQKDEGPYLTSFVFLGGHHIVVAKDMSEGGSRDSAALYFVNLSSGSREGKLYLPRLDYEDTVTEGLELLSEPSSMWIPPMEDTPPFHVSQGQRLVILMLNVPFFTTVSFAFLSTGLLEAANTYGQDYPNGVPWDIWGEARCRAHFSEHWDGIWPCVVYGTKHIFAPLIDEDDEHDRIALVIRDYNQKAIRYSLAHPGSHSEPTSRSQLVMDDGSLEFEPQNMRIFANSINTTLPFRELVLHCNLTIDDYAMISEDSIVVIRVGHLRVTLSFTRSLDSRRMKLRPFPCDLHNRDRK